MTLSQFWTSLDRLPDASCARYDWRFNLGETYAAAEPLLKPTGKRAQAVTCPQLSGDQCPRRVTKTAAGTFRAFCENNPQQCDPLDLTQDEVNVLAPDKAVLTTRIGKALSLSGVKPPDPKANVWHVGDRVAENGGRVPVYFAIVGAEDADKTSIFAPVVAGKKSSLLIVPTASTLSAEQSDYLAKSSISVRPAGDLIAVAKDGGFSATLLAGRIIEEMETRAAALIASAPLRAWQLPQGTEWPKVTIDFISAEVINVSCGGPGRRIEPDQLGLKNKKNGKPKEAWFLLKQFALSGGILPHHEASEPTKMEKRKQELSRALRDSFGIDSDPIKVVKGEYRALFVATATGLSQGHQGQVSRKFGTARK